jgi:hypothetical protein
MVFNSDNTLMCPDGEYIYAIESGSYYSPSPTYTADSEGFNMI